jgi:hypothetical protein
LQHGITKGMQSGVADDFDMGAIQRELDNA